ncbi:MAG: fluoride efflux transporter CrcB [Eubacteriales bacterium]|nr:fluoride efflux transporter CrcB [Eubacteriales bacterium]
MDFVAVGVGGALGSVLRYLVSLLPFTVGFPLATFIVNFLGAVIIGFLSGFSVDRVSPRIMLLFKTGFCGGFTTFSTFSLESFTLLEKGQYRLGVLYIGLSLICCLAGIFLGRLLASRLRVGA